MRQIKLNSATVYWDEIGLPFIVFKDGKSTYALPRQSVETEALGYADTASGNFEHEVIHVFVNEKLDEPVTTWTEETEYRRKRLWVDNSVLRRAALGQEFVGQALVDALFEESLVLGIQIAMNKYQECDEQGNTVLPGFCFHMARGCYLNAQRELALLGLDIDALAQEVLTILRPVAEENASCPLGYNCLEVPTTNRRPTSDESDEVPHAVSYDIEMGQGGAAYNDVMFG